jgi:TnpA family transposase
VAECSELAQPSDYNSLAYAAKSFSHIRQFTPRFLDVIRFDSDQKTASLLEAVAFMRQFNAEGRRKLVDAPVDFIPWRWRKHVVSKGQVVNRALYEMCLSECLIQAVDDGQLWVESSREHISFRRDWIGDEEWPAARRAFLAKYPQLADVSHYLARMRRSLNERMSEVARRWPELEDQVEIVDGSIHLSRLEALAEPEGTAPLRATIQRLFPRRSLPELLTEVNGWTGFADHLTSLNPQVRQISNLIARKLAAVMALGMNIGLENMANAVAGMSYEELAWVADWYIREDTLRQAIVELVNFLTALPVSRHWGDGTTSSSDGQLFGVQARTLYARVNPHAPEKGASMNVYTHVADNLSPFYSRLIESTAGEAAYILDGLLYHETDLRPREHYSDTRGYTDALFGLCHLLGFRFAPRLRDLSERRLFRMRRNLNEYPNIKSLFFGRKGSSRLINTRVIREGWDDVLRLAASVENGVMPASRALRKLSTHHPESRLYKALREVGRIDKTLFLLNYISDLALRRRVLVGLNKGESYQALARSLVIALGGVLKSRSIEGQVNQITCLRLLATAIIVWNAVYMEKAAEALRQADYEINDAQIAHIYPMMLEHLNLIDEYRFPADGRALTKLDALPLRSLDEALSQLSLDL